MNREDFVNEKQSHLPAFDGGQQCPRTTRMVMFIIAAIALNQALQIWCGILNTGAISFLLIACIAAFCGALDLRFPAIERLGREALLIAFIVGLAMQFAQIMMSPPGIYDGTPKAYVTIVFASGTALCAGLVLWGISGRDRSGRKWFFALIVVHFLLGIWVLYTSPPIMIDVLLFQRGASAALIHGQNPYSVTFPNIYGEHTSFYGPEAVVNGKLTYGYPYPPLTLLLSLPAYVFAGDIRYAHLAAISLSGLLIGFTGRSVVSKLAAVLFLFSPRAFYVAQISWTEPFLVALFSLVVFMAARSRRPLPLFLGLLIAAKQYLVFAAPAAWLLLPKPSITAYCRLVLWSGAVALAVTLPFAVWNFGAFFRAVVLWQFAQPFRADALSFPAFFVSMGWPRLPVLVPFLAVLFLGQHLLRKLPPTPANFAGGLSIIYLLFFALNKQAFHNYYFFAVGCLCCAIATADRRSELAGTDARPSD